MPSTERTPNRKAQDGLEDEAVDAVTPDTLSIKAAGAAAHGARGGRNWNRCCSEDQAWGLD